jgi:hypothetical protein
MAEPFTTAIIERARDLIADRKHWCRFALAKDKYGQHVNATDPMARRFCAVGALIATANELTSDPLQANALGRLAANIVSSRGEWTLLAVNDFRGHAAVIAFFDKAIAQARERPGPG